MTFHDIVTRTLWGLFIAFMAFPVVIFYASTIAHAIALGYRRGKGD